MKRLLLALAVLLPLGAHAQQPPRDVVVRDSISLAMGQVRTMEFDQSFRELKVAVEGVIKMTPITDRTLSIEGLRPGEVMAIFYGEGGKETYRMNIRVDGRMVKVYGWKDKDYTSFYCGESGCGRADPDVERGPNKTTVTETTTKPDGSAVSIAKEYR